MSRVDSIHTEVLVLTQITTRSSRPERTIESKMVQTDQRLLIS